MEKSETGDIDDHATPLRVFDEDNTGKWRKIAKPRRCSEPGSVFEIDGLAMSGVIYLGRAGEDWTAIAQQRLEQ
ncbi:hypothetical protein BG005_004049, partial [Podila minutissima]